MTWRSYIYPQTIARFASLYNKDIRVVEEHGRNKILVNGSPQSGPYIEKLWKQACRAFAIPKKFSPESILVMGIAGGTVIHLLSLWYPHAKITAVDIDQTMIDIGKRFFGLKQMKNLVMKQADAKVFVSQEGQKSHHYDLIIVDLSFGRIIPAFVIREDFLKDIKTLKGKNGLAVINFLRERQYREISKHLKQTLANLFERVAEKAIFFNRFFCVR